MPRRSLILAAVIVALHLLEAATLGTSTTGSLLANLLEIFACGFAAVMAFGAARRGHGLSRPFWILVGMGISMWGVANLGWMYYEVVLTNEPPLSSAVRFLFGFEDVLIAMALFLDQDKDSPRIDVEAFLDFVQIGIVFFFIFLEFYFLPARRLDEHAAFLREMRVENLEDVMVAALAGFRALTARRQHLRKLYAGLAVYVSFVTLLAATAQYLQMVRPAPTGTLRDLLWTLPLLAGGLWAAEWKPSATEGTGRQVRRKSLSELLITNGTLALAPLIILFQVSQLEAEWRLLRFSLLGVSIVCYAARLAISQHREAKSAKEVMTHALAMDSAADGISILGKDGEYLYVNSAFAKMMGFEQASVMLGKNWREVYDKRDIALLEDHVRDSLKLTGKWSEQVSLSRPDGARIPVEMSITAMPQRGVVCVARDISDRLRAERAHLETEAKYKLFVEQVAAVSYIAEVGLHGKWHYVSPQVETILGHAQEEWLAQGEDWILNVFEEDHPIVEAAEENFMRVKRFQAEYRIKRKDGRVIWVSDNAVFVPGSESHPLMEGIIVDITERRVLEEQLQQARRMEAVGRLAGGVAHDFNNLLTIIKGYVELALNRVAALPELRGNIQQIADAAERAVTLVRQLLAFSRKQVLRPKLLDLNSIVLNMDKMVRRLISDTIEMRTRIDKNLGAVKADPGQIEQVILNLIVNARDAMPDGGKLWIETSNVELGSAIGHDRASSKPGPYVVLSVTDTGVGISADTLPHIFEPFYTTKESSRGTGLGLSTVYGIVKQSGGHISVHSELGKGTTFNVYLPRVEDSIPEPRKVEEAELAKREGKETILLAEDEPAVRELARMVLSEQGYTVIEAQNAEDAVRLAGRHGSEIHLLLTDVAMPGMSGRDLANHLTALHPYLRVLYMSGYTYNVIAENGTLEEGLSFLQKPFTPKALAQRVRETLDRPVVAD
ncbi:MAG TPA: PAS domain S-box protein [Candidatus Dormibacteraeota bacterium]|nr:PAS domain S-box protein [Candidatus Dormibacteraeota bacterium]